MSSNPLLPHTFSIHTSVYEQLFKSLVHVHITSAVHLKHPKECSFILVSLMHEKNWQVTSNFCLRHTTVSLKIEDTDGHLTAPSGHGPETHQAGDSTRNTNSFLSTKRYVCFDINLQASGDPARVISLIEHHQALLMTFPWGFPTIVLTDFFQQALGSAFLQPHSSDALATGNLPGGPLSHHAESSEVVWLGVPTSLNPGPRPALTPPSHGSLGSASL